MSNLSPEIVQRFVRYGANTRNFMPLFLKNPSWPAETSVEYPGSFSIRTAAARDVEGLAEYFGNLSQTSRYNRFMGAVNNFSKIALHCLIHCSKEDRFTLLAELKEPSGDAIVGEASYAFDCESGYGEFAISVSDHWQRHGLGWRCSLHCNSVPLAWAISYCSAKPREPTIR
jgi:hypothetical protein